jgi:hypothetical protein
MKIILSNFLKESLILNKKKYINIFFKKKYKKNTIIKKDFLKSKKIFFYKNFRKKYKNYYQNSVYLKNKSKKILLKKIESLKKKEVKDNNGSNSINIINNNSNNTDNSTKDFIVKFCVFLGREKNMKILHYYLEEALKSNIINEYHMFDFSRNNNDHLFINNEFQRLKLLYNNKIYLHNYDNNEIILKKKRVKTDWNPFYKTISSWNENDVVIKCDDDILFIDINSLKNAIEDRINDKISFIIHSNCINNGVCAYYQRDLFPKLKNELSKYPSYGIMGILFEKPELAYVLHNQFSNDLLTNINNINKYILDDIYITSRISINFILINGCDLKYLENISTDDEYQVSSLLPEKLLRPNKIKGDLITSHLSYTFQDKILLNRSKLLHDYQKITEKYSSRDIFIDFKKNFKLSPKIHLKNDIFKIESFFNENNFYIKCVNNNKYLYIDYEEDQLKLSSEKKTIFEINDSKLNKNGIIIKLGIYFITYYSILGKFRNENIYIRYFKDEKEKEIIKEKSNENNYFYLKFAKYNNYLSLKSDDYIFISPKSEYKWIFEKVENKKYFYFKRILKNNKFYYINIENENIYTNYCLGWGINNLLW